MARSKKDKSIPPSEDDLILVRDDELLPRHLDEHVASLRIRTTANYFNDGYDVLVSAFFGSERVPLSVEDVELSTTISLQKAEIVIDGLSSDIAIQNPPQNETSEILITQIEEKSTKVGRNLGAGAEAKLSQSTIDLSADVSAKINRNSDHGITEKVEAAKKLRGWDLISDRTISIYRRGHDLEGNEVPETAVWRVFPRVIDAASGVILQIRVREDWLTFRGTRFERGKSGMGLAIEKLFSSENTRKRELFDVLIKHLTFIGLQSSDDKSQATLANAAIVVRPELETSLSLPSKGRAELRLPSRKIRAFLDAEDGQEDEPHRVCRRPFGLSYAATAV
jgi:hypothetical protein